MSAARTTRLWNLAVSAIGVVLLYYAAVVAWERWNLRQRTIKISAPPHAIRDDIAAWTLAIAIQREAGIDAEHYMILPFQSSGTHPCVGRDPRNPDVAKLSFSSGIGSTIAKYRYVGVRLEQEGTNVIGVISPSR